ncbi:MAG TPA: hypothetical protein PKY25_00105 [Bacilli bacterium]|nr:hypothetical protein [Bacilli bacterium]
MFILETACYNLQVKTIIGAIRYIVTFIQFVVPVLLIVWGILDLSKAITAGKEEEIKKWRKTLVDRIIAAVIVFLVPFIVFTITGLLGDSKWKDCWQEASEVKLSDLVNFTENQGKGKKAQ